MYDSIIIGSGPAGLSAAVYAARAQLQAVVIEKDSMGSGQIAVSEQVDNYLGLPGIGGYELGEKFREHAAQMGAVFLEEEVCCIARNADESYTVSCKSGRTISGRSIIYAAGTSYRRLEIPGDTLLGVSYCAVCDGAFYQDKTVAVIGGGDTALEDALYLSGIAKSVYLIHRRDSFRANRTLQSRVKETSNIICRMETVPTEIYGEKHVQRLCVTHRGELEEIQLDGVFVAIGSIPNTELLQGIVELDAGGYIIAGEDGVTSLPGFFAAGDVRTKALRQVVTAVADGANCIQSLGFI